MSEIGPEFIDNSEEWIDTLAKAKEECGFRFESDQETEAQTLKSKLFELWKNSDELFAQEIVENASAYQKIGEKIVENSKNPYANLGKNIDWALLVYEGCKNNPNNVELKEYCKDTLYDLAECSLYEGDNAIGVLANALSKFI